MKNKKILIIGLGLIGASYAQGLTKKGYLIYGANRSEKALNEAKKRKIIIDGILLKDINKEYLEDFKYIIMGLYPQAMVDFLEEHKDDFAKDTIITDVSGVKSFFINDLQNILPCEFIGAHPMAGKEKSGIDNCDYTIFKNANYIITNTTKNTDKGIEFAKEIGEALEFKKISFLSPKEHDEMIAFLSQLTHCIAITLMTARDSAHFINYTGDSFRDLTRIASINENMWSELFIENKDVLVKQMDLFINEFLKLKENIEKENIEEIKKTMILSTERRKKFDI